MVVVDNIVNAYWSQSPQAAMDILKGLIDNRYLLEFTIIAAEEASYDGKSALPQSELHAIVNRLRAIKKLCEARQARAFRSERISYDDAAIIKAMSEFHIDVQATLYFTMEYLMFGRWINATGENQLHKSEEPFVAFIREMLVEDLKVSLDSIHRNFDAYVEAARNPIFYGDLFIVYLADSPTGLYSLGDIMKMSIQLFCDLGIVNPEVERDLILLKMHLK